MSGPALGDITRLLAAMKGGDRAVEDDLYRLVLAELRALAQRHLLRVPHDGVIEATSLVNEAWIRLHVRGQKRFENRRHFFAVAGRAIHDAAVDEARRCGAQKRGGKAKRVDLVEALPNPTLEPESFLELHAAIDRLRQVDPPAAELVEQSYFLGLTHQQIADLRGESLSTVRRAWRFAHAFLRRELEPEGDPDARQPPPMPPGP